MAVIWLSEGALWIMPLTLVSQLPVIWRRLAGAMIILCGVALLSFSKHRNEVRTAGGSV